jgi:hypothetical protein
VKATKSLPSLTKASTNRILIATATRNPTLFPVVNPLQRPTRWTNTHHLTKSEERGTSLTGYHVLRVASLLMRILTFIFDSLSQLPSRDSLSTHTMTIMVNVASRDGVCRVLLSTQRRANFGLRDTLVCRVCGLRRAPCFLLKERTMLFFLI